MPNAKSNPFKLNGRLLFFQEFLRHPLQIGSIIPSSRFLERRVVAAAGVAGADVVVELGPGVGGITKAILGAMHARATLVSIEINPHFHAMVRGIGDRRLIAHLGSADELEAILSKYSLGSANAVVSGIPFSTMDRSTGLRILQSISASLAPQGRFVAYQLHHQVAELGRPILGAAQTSTELFNIPPMRVYLWEKRV